MSINPTLSDLLKEGRKFAPSNEFTKNANVNNEKIYDEASADHVAFWEKQANQLDWFQKWETGKALEWNPPHAKWFLGGKLNASVNCLDRHVFSEDSTKNLKNKIAIHWEGEPGDKLSLTYEELYKKVCQFSNALKNNGVKKGDRVAIYMPMTPEIIIACLACSRIGAVHNVVFGGFSSESLRDRIQDASAKLLITADFGWRRGKKIPLKEFADKAVEECGSIEKVVVVKRELQTKPQDDSCSMTVGRDIWWHDAIEGVDESCEPEVMDAEDMLFILYTSGTTGKPKGIVHTTGGYLTGVNATTRWVFDLKPDDVYWCMADVGWITGHSYVIYGPLSNGATVLIYEGSPDYPDKGRTWKLIQDYRATILYTAPTAIRAFMKWGTQWPEEYDLSSLRLLGSVGEPINPEAWVWYHKYVGQENCPIVDTWWQTETGAIMISPLPGITTTKPASATKPLPGVSIEILNEAGEVIPSGGGYPAITKPWPSMLRTIYGDDKRYKDQYWSKWSGDKYFPGDGAKRDEDGYFWFLGRVDDVMNVSGHRIGTMEVESALVDHPSVAEAAVVGREHDVKGTAIAAFVTLKEGVESKNELVAELRKHVATKIGAIAKPDDILFSADLPKTRSGKIMRRLLRDIAEGRALGDTTTLADPSVVESLRKKYESIEA